MKYTLALIALVVWQTTSAQTSNPNIRKYATDDELTAIVMAAGHPTMAEGDDVIMFRKNTILTARVLARGTTCKTVDLSVHIKPGLVGGDSGPHISREIICVKDGIWAIN